MPDRHPRDAWITVYGRKPVLEVLEQPELAIGRVFVAHNARGAMIARILEAAAARGVEVRRESADRVSRISKKPKQDQGVAADVAAPQMGSLEAWLGALEGPARILALDHVSTPANVGMILRTATVLGLDGVLLPRRGVPEVGPLVVKASAGVAYRARILRCAELPDGLSEAKMNGFCVYGLSDAGGTEGVAIESTRSRARQYALGRERDEVAREGSLETAPTTELAALRPRERSVFVLGNESDGITEATRALVDEWVRIDMASTGDSLNVAAAAAIVAWAVRP